MKYRIIPQVNTVMESPAFKDVLSRHGRIMTRNCLRTVLDRKRVSISTLTPSDFSEEKLAGETADEIDSLLRSNLRRVFNATGTILHTNLGRAPLAPEALKAVAEVSQGYCNLEMDLSTGNRSRRNDAIASTLELLTGAESAIAVNNNAGAVLLVLMALAKNKEVIVSRGELIEIGGGFRIPEVMQLSGAVLREVGTTNRTHPHDYENAIHEQTGLILKTSTSNYAIVGFTSEVVVDELIAMGKQHGIPVLYDLGSGNFFNGAPFGWESPLVPDLIKSGIDVITFSGDKLLGGPQAGIIAGRKIYIDRIASHPMARALRLDKMTLAALDTTLKLYLEPELVQDRIPCLKALCTNQKEIAGRARYTARKIEPHIPDFIRIHVAEEFSTVGGGALPLTRLPTWGIAIQCDNRSANDVSDMLRASYPPIVARIQKDTVFLDMRTISDSELKAFTAALLQALQKTGS